MGHDRRTRSGRVRFVVLLVVVSVASFAATVLVFSVAFEVWTRLR